MAVEIVLATSDTDVDVALGIAEAVWGQPQVSRAIARAMSFAGWYVSLARLDGEPAGMCAGFVGVHGAELHLHSHLAAVRPGMQGRGIGRALKLHQRAWCLDHGIEVVTWTFDPLVRENARFNLHHLGAAGDRYIVDLYGEMDDVINRGQPSDRLLIRWDLAGEAATFATETPLPVSETAVWEEAGAERAVRSDAGVPVARDTDAALRLVATPESIVDLRRHHPSVALDWRLAVRHAMTAGFADGLRPVAMTDDGSYLLTRGEVR